jgi:hypothetical protein
MIFTTERIACLVPSLHYICSRFSIWTYCSTLIKEPCNSTSAIFFSNLFYCPGCIINTRFSSQYVTFLFANCQRSHWRACSSWTYGSLACVSLIQYSFLASLLLVLEVVESCEMGDSRAGDGSDCTCRCCSRGSRTMKRGQVRALGRVPRRRRHSCLSGTLWVVRGKIGCCDHA